jgi:hypothetical protein
MPHYSHHMTRSRVRAPTLIPVETEVRHAFFVGRQYKLALWQKALSGNGACIPCVPRPAGIGKTSLLQSLDAEARRCSITTMQVDARDLGPRFSSAVGALDSAWQSSPGDDSDDLQREFLLDTYEHLREIEPLVRRALLRRTHRMMLLVVAGRLPPSAECRALSLLGRRHFANRIAKPLPSGEGVLARREMYGEAASAMVAISYSHPRELVIAAEAWRQSPKAAFLPRMLPTPWSEDP